jgi:uncharacterized protein YukE
MDDEKDRRHEWQQVGAQLSSLGDKLQLHFQRAAKEGRHEEADTLHAALAALSDSIDQAAEAVAKIARDDAVKQDVVDVGRSLVEVLEHSFADVVERVRAPRPPKQA